MTELKPCPFCPDGGRPELVCGIFGSFYVRCAECGVYRASPLPGLEEDAINAWNTRAERTCKPEIENHGALILTRYPCCGYELKVSRYSSYPEEAFNNCPNCGAKVVGD